MNYKEILSHPTAEAFMDAVRQYGKYCRGLAVIPTAVEKNHRECLKSYRKYLDDNGVYMRVPRFMRKYDDV